MVDDKTAEKFATYMKKYPILYEHLAEVVQKQISHAKPLIIDLGVGPGLLSAEIHKKVPSATVIGIDPLSSMLSLASKNACFEKFVTIQSVSESIPVKNNSADIVVSRFSLPYWKTPKDSFDEIFRVLKPGGKVVLEALNRDFPKWKLFLIKLHMLFNKAGGDVVRYHIDAYNMAYTVDHVEQFLTDAKFTIIEKEGNIKDWKFIVVAEK